MLYSCVHVGMEKVYKNECMLCPLYTGVSGMLYLYATMLRHTQASPDTCIQSDYTHNSTFSSSVYSKGQRQIVQTGYGHQIPCSEMVGLLASVNYTIIYNYTGVKWLAFSGQIFMGFVYLQFFEKQPWMKLLKAYIIHVYKSIGKTSKMKVQRLCQLWEEIKTWVINYLRVARNLIMCMFWISTQTSLKQS